MSRLCLSTCQSFFDHQPSAGTAFLRRVMLAAQEFERDIIMERLQHELAKARNPDASRSNHTGAAQAQSCHHRQDWALANKGWTQREIRDTIRTLLNRPSLGTSTAMRILSQVERQG